MSTRCRDVVCGVPICGVVTVNKLIESRTLLLKNTPGWPGPFTSEVARTRRLPTAKVVLGCVAAYNSRSVSSRIDWI
jgi:hypothetical protein